MEKISENFIPAVMKVEDLAKVLSIGLNSAYDLVRSGQVRSLKVGRIYRIPKSAVEEYLNSAG